MVVEKEKNLKFQCCSLRKASHCLVLKGQGEESLSLSNLHCKVVFLFNPSTITMFMQMEAYSVTEQHLNLFNC